MVGLNRIALNTLIALATKIVALLLGFFSLGLTTRFLGQAGFGVYSTALAYGYIVSFIADLGLYSLMVREVSQVPLRQKEALIASNIFTLRVVSLSSFYALGLIGAIFFARATGYPFSVFILGLAQYIFLSLAQVLVGIFQKHLQMKFVSLAEILGRSVSLFLLFLFIFYSPWLEARAKPSIVLFAFASGALIIFLLHFFWARRFVKVTLKADPLLWKRLISQAVPIGLSAILTGTYLKMDTIILAFLRSDVEVGLYNGAYKILEVLIFFPAAFVGIIMPQLSRFALVNRERFETFFRAGLETLLLAAFPISAGVFLKADQIVSLIAGQAFLPSAKALKILALSAFMIFFGALFSNALIARRKQWHLAKIYFLGAIVNVGTNLLVIPSFGYLGAAATSLLTETLVTALMFLSLRDFFYFEPARNKSAYFEPARNKSAYFEPARNKLVYSIDGTSPFRLIKRRVIAIVASTLLMMTFFILVPLSLLASIIFGGAVYLLGLFLLKGIRKEDILLITKR